MTRFRFVLALAGCLTLTWAGTALAAITAAQKCQAAKLKAAGKDAACQASALAKAALGGVNTVSQCDAKLTAKFTKLEAKGGCATTNDAPTTAGRIDASSIIIQALYFYPFNFTNNGDGTVTDSNTGLQWEQKTFDSTSVHYYPNLYTWSSAGCVNGPPDPSGILFPAVGDNGTGPDGTAFGTFLAALNDATAPGGCFAAHCDWRLPTIAELGTIVDRPCPSGGYACVDAIFGPTAAVYWSATTDSSSPNKALLTQLGPALSWDKCGNAIIVPINARAVRKVSGPNCGSVAEPCCSGGRCNDPDTVCTGVTCVACGPGCLPDLVALPRPGSTGPEGFCQLSPDLTQLQVHVINQATIAGSAASTTRVDFANNAGVDMPTPPLGPSGSAVVEFAIPASCYDAFNNCHFTIVVDSTNAVIESNETNNNAAGICGPGIQ